LSLFSSSLYSPPEKQPNQEYFMRDTDTSRISGSDRRTCDAVPKGYHPFCTKHSAISQGYVILHEANHIDHWLPTQL
jgi:hypothetical protein